MPCLLMYSLTLQFEQTGKTGKGARAAVRKFQRVCVCVCVCLQRYWAHVPACLLSFFSFLACLLDGGWGGWGDVELLLGLICRSAGSWRADPSCADFDDDDDGYGCMYVCM